MKNDRKVKIVINCRCGTETVVEEGEPLFCSKCGTKPIFRYTNDGYYRFEGTYYDAGAVPIVERKADFRMFKRLTFQFRDKAINEASYLHFLAGYFGIIPTADDLLVPEKGYYKIKNRR